MAFLDWIHRRGHSSRVPEPTPLPTASKVQGRSTPDEVIATERSSSAPEWSYQGSLTAKGNPVIWQGEERLGLGCYVHIGKSAEGFHGALETPEDYHDPEWGTAHLTAEAPRRETVPKDLNPDLHKPHRTSIGRVWER